MKQKMHLYYDKEGDFLEIRFGEPTESTYEKIGEDTYERIDKETKEVKGYTVYNVQKSSGASIDIQIPAKIIKALKKQEAT